MHNFISSFFKNIRSLNKVIKNSILYTSVSILQKAIGFFLLPFYTAYLSTAAYGTVSFVISIQTFLSIFYTFSLNGAATRFYYLYRNEKEYIKEIWGTIFTFIFINSLIQTVIFILLRNVLIKPFLNEIPFYPYILIGFLTISINPIYRIFQSTLQAKQEGKQFALNNLLFFLLNIGLTILFVAGFKWKAVGILLAALITNFIFFIYALIAMLPKIKLGINKKWLLKTLKYSLPLIPHAISGWTLGLLDRIFLNNMRNASDVGLYNIGFQFGNIINILTIAVNQAYVPWFFEQMKNGEEGKNRIISYSNLIVTAYVFGALVISLFSIDILKFMVTPDFYYGWKVVPFISFAYVFNGIYFIFVNLLFLEKTYLVSIVTISGAAINIILNYLLIPQYGIAGAAFASLISRITISVIAFLVSRKVEKINFKYMYIYVLSIISFLVSLTIFFDISLYLKIIISIAYLIFTFFRFRKRIVSFCSSLKRIS